MYPRDRKLFAGFYLFLPPLVVIHKKSQFIFLSFLLHSASIKDRGTRFLIWQSTSGNFLPSCHSCFAVICSICTAERRIASMTKMEFERMASEAQLKADEEAEAALESVDQIEGVLRRPSQIGNQGNTRTWFVNLRPILSFLFFCQTLWSSTCATCATPQTDYKVTRYKVKSLIK